MVVETAAAQQSAYMPPPVYAPLQQYAVFDCPYCHTNVPPFKQSKIAPAGWILLVIMVFVCLPLFWIGLFIKEEESICSGCGIKLGQQTTF